MSNASDSRDDMQEPSEVKTGEVTCGKLHDNLATGEVHVCARAKGHTDFCVGPLAEVAAAESDEQLTFRAYRSFIGNWWWRADKSDGDNICYGPFESQERCELEGPLRVIAHSRRLEPKPDAEEKKPEGSHPRDRFVQPKARIPAQPKPDAEAKPEYRYFIGLDTAKAIAARPVETDADNDVRMMALEYIEDRQAELDEDEDEPAQPKPDAAGEATRLHDRLVAIEHDAGVAISEIADNDAATAKKTLAGIAELAHDAIAALSAPRNPDLAAAAKEMAEALVWYETYAIGCRKLGSAGDPFRHGLDSDGGNRAHAALARYRALGGK